MNVKATRKALEERIQELEEALERSVKLQSHYAGLLNIWDGGERMKFTDAEDWLARLRVVKASVAGNA